MAYWFAFQSDNYEIERNGGYLWASDSTHAARRSILDLKFGDVVFSYVKRGKKVLSIGFVKGEPARQYRKDLRGWGFKVPLQYNEIDQPLDFARVRDAFAAKLEGHVLSPLNKNKQGNQGYLYPLPDDAGIFLCSEIENDNDNSELIERAKVIASLSDNIENSIINSKDIEQTEKEALILSRVGQGKFRNDLMKFWDQACAVTEIYEDRLLSDCLRTH